MGSRPRSRAADRPAGGERLQADVTAAICAAASEELAAGGIARMSMDAVARRAGVGKAALYRRWATREDLVVDLVAGAGLEYADAPDTGSLSGDVAALLANATTILREPRTARIASHVYAELATDSPLADRLRVAVQPHKRAPTEAIVARAVGRGELSRTVGAASAEPLLMGPLLWHVLVLRAAPSPDLLEGLTRSTVAALHALATA